MTAQPSEQIQQWHAVADAAPTTPVPFPTTHGARSPRLVDPLAAELAAGLLEDRPDLASYPEAVAAWSRFEAALLLYQRFHAQYGVLNEDGQVRGGSHYFTTERRAAELRLRLGLDPLAEATLRKTQAEAAHTVVDLAAIQQRGREALARRAAFHAVEGGGPDDDTG